MDWHKGEECDWCTIQSGRTYHKYYAFDDGPQLGRFSWVMYLLSFDRAGLNFDDEIFYGITLEDCKQAAEDYEKMLRGDT